MKERCPNCGQGGSLDAIALASGPWSGLRGERCAACERFWVGYAELDGPGGDELCGASARAVWEPAQPLCRCCGAGLKARPGLEGLLACEACRIVLADERSYDALELDETTDEGPA